MCGIAGFLDVSHTKRQEDLETAVMRMGDTLAHRGPDDRGIWVDEHSGLAFGHRRLSIIDLSPEGHQPMHSACGRYVIVFNGEIYNFHMLRGELERLGVAPRWRGRSDTEVLLAAIGQWGIEVALARVVGMFAFALWDCKKRLLHLIRDRLGIKPLYYGWVGRTFLFGSELKALRAHPEFTGMIDRDALALYLRHGYIPTPHCIYAGVHKLPPGAMLTIRGTDTASEPDPVPYWSARDVTERGIADPFPGEQEEAVAQLDNLLRDAVKLRMIADVPLGALLSGGIDSSTVVALMQTQSNRPVRTFTIGFRETGYDEAVYAKAVACHLGTDHTELVVTPGEARAIIPRLPLLYDEPFSDSSQIPTCLVSTLTRERVKVALSGDGGDELFGGYNRHIRGTGIWRAVGWLPDPVRRLLGGALCSIRPGDWDRLLETLGPVLPNRLRRELSGDRVHKLATVLPAESKESFYYLLTSMWKDPAAVVINGSEPRTRLNASELWPRVSEYRQWMMALDLMTYLPDDILTKVDRASMGTGLEVRVPFLDHRVVEFAWCLPLSLKFRNGQGKWLLRQILYQHVPANLVERPKMGFAIPLHEWLRGPLYEWAESLLDEERLRNESFFDPEPIRAKWSEHISGQRNWQHDLWAILMFQAWLETQ